MLDRVLRPVKDRVLSPLASPLAPVAHPLIVTAVGFTLGAACAGSLYLGDHAAGLAFWIGNRVLDGLDGLIARTAGRQTDLGGYLDLLLDFVVYAAIPIALVYPRSVPPEPGSPLVLALLLAAFYVNAASWMYLSALLTKAGAGEAPEARAPTSIEMPPGIVEGTETIAFYIAFIVFPEALRPLMLTLAGLTAATVVQRLVWAVRSLPRDPYGSGGK